MFRQFTQSDPECAKNLFRLHPVELAVLLELAWEFRIHDESRKDEVGHPDRRSELPELPKFLLDLFPVAAINRNGTSGPGENIITLLGEVRWDHLIYAYMIENTRIYDIFRRVLYEFLHGEKLGVPIVDSQHWLRNTEELFFKEPASFFIYSVISYIRPDLGATRRNAYYRMFGMDLNHGRDDQPGYPYVKADAANKDFVKTFEEFLMEVWIGITNVTNTSGANPTDNATIARLANELHDMLRTRRESGNLSREEFFFVSMMSWFHLSLEFNSPIVIALRAEASSEDQRLFKIAERVNLPAHAKTFDFFKLADPMSRILTQIELGTFNKEEAVPALFSPGTPVEADMRRIITHWSIATGHDMKATRVKTPG